MSYYDHNADQFFNETFSLDMTEIYQPFLARLQPGSRILDAGCGSGRDALAFKQLGFAVTAFDASPELVNLARTQTGLDVQCSCFLDFQEKPDSFNAIWACASLLHLPYAEIKDTFRHLARFLIRGGVFYCSFKYGDDEVERGGRHFTNLNEKRLQDVISATGLKIDTTWQTEDRRPERAGEFWLNGLLRLV